MKLKTVLLTLGLTGALIAILPVAALVVGVSGAEVIAACGDGDVLAAIALSLGCAFLAVLLGAVFAVPAAYLIARRSVPGVRWGQALLDLPLVIPHPIVGIGLLMAFGRGSLLGAALEDGLGVRIASAVPGIVIAMTVVSSPLIVRAAVAGFRAVPVSLERTAFVLGASPWRTFLTVSLPLAQPTVRAGLLLAWARAISEFGSIAVLAYYPRTAPVLIWDRFTARGIDAAAAPSLLLLVVCLAAFLFWQWLERDLETGVRG